jgi:hypothetical protein
LAISEEAAVHGTPRASGCFGPTTPTRAGRLADASVDPTEARNDNLGCFGRSDEARNRPIVQPTGQTLLETLPPRRGYELFYFIQSFSRAASQIGGWCVKPWTVFNLRGYLIAISLGFKGVSQLRNGMHTLQFKQGGNRLPA